MQTHVAHPTSSNSSTCNRYEVLSELETIEQSTEIKLKLANQQEIGPAEKHGKSAEGRC